MTKVDPSGLKVFRLEPIAEKLEQPEWDASLLKETCWVRAASENEARLFVERETRTRQAHSPAKLPFFSPWASPAFVLCAVEKEATDDAYPLGTIITTRGPFPDRPLSS
jgi:hypothetical protein